MENLELINLRKTTGMNRKEFCEYLEIPYRTVTEWELGNRTMPDYLYKLIKYRLKTEKVLKEIRLLSDDLLNTEDNN